MMETRQASCSTSSGIPSHRVVPSSIVFSRRRCPQASQPLFSGRLGRTALPLRRQDTSAQVGPSDQLGPSAPPYPSVPAYPSGPAYASVPSYPLATEPPPLDQPRLDETARKALVRATGAVKRYGWISFWVQLSLSVVSGVILLFSVAFTSQSGPRASLYLTLFGIVAGFLSTFWNYGYTRTGMRMQAYIDRMDMGQVARPQVPKVKKQQVMDMVTKGVFINIVGLGSTLLGVQALVGILVAKTLSNASANPFLMSGNGVYNPVLALDVFLVQAATNTLLGHFLSLVCSLWLLSVVSDGRGLRFKNPLASDSDSLSASSAVSGSSVSTKRGNAATYRLKVEDGDERY